MGKSRTAARVDSMGAFKVETWWDRRSRNWITQVLTHDDIEVRGWDNVYTGAQVDARSAHADACSWVRGYIAAENNR